MAAFLGHIAKESENLNHLEESLYYKDAHRLNLKFAALKTDKEAEAYLRKPEALANKVYANRIGNGDIASGDGWRYRGRGLIQLTGKSNYQDLAKDLKVDFVKDPELVATPKYAAIAAAWFWKKRGLNELADDQRYQALSLKINKKLDSFAEREANRQRALDALCRGVLVNLAMSLRMGGFGSWF
jgi:putative chitinase